MRKIEASLDHREADIAVRLNRPRRGDLKIMRLGEITLHFYASPAYLTATALRREIWLAVHADLRTAPAVRAVVDALKEAI